MPTRTHSRGSQEEEEEEEEEEVVVSEERSDPRTVERREVFAGLPGGRDLGEAPGPFALSDTDALRGLFDEAGLGVVAVEDVECVWRYPDEPTGWRA